MDPRWEATAPNIGAWQGNSEQSWTRRLAGELESRGVDVVLDVGANAGQYAAGLRGAGYRYRIVSFEPLARPFARLQRNAAPDPLWECRQHALGESEGMVRINVAGNDAGSSSVLPMLDTHRDVFPIANYVGTEEAAIRRLDSVAPEMLRPNDAVFLKIDVQGFEKHVIEGGQETVRRCVGLQVELSLVPLYEGGPLIDEVVALARSVGFTLTDLVPGFTDIRTGRVLQADGLFFRVEA